MVRMGAYAQQLSFHFALLSSHWCKMSKAMLHARCGYLNGRLHGFVLPLLRIRCVPNRAAQSQIKCANVFHVFFWWAITLHRRLCCVYLCLCGCPLQQKEESCVVCGGCEAGCVLCIRDAYSMIWLRGWLLLFFSSYFWASVEKTKTRRNKKQKTPGFFSFFRQ